MGSSTIRALLEGLGITLLLAVSSLAVAMAGGIVVALGRLSPRAWIRLPATVYVEVIRGVPLLVLLLWIYFGFFSEVLAAMGIPLQGIPAAILAFGLCYSAFIGETYRAGIQSVDPGQREAALALGLSDRQAMRWVILPQAIRNVLPALGNESIALVKDTSLAMAIAIPELMMRAKQEASRSFRTMEVFTEAAVIYLVVTLLLSRLQRVLERRLGAAHRDTGTR